MTSTTLSNTDLKSSSSLGHEGSIICFGDIHGHLPAAESAISLAEEELVWTYGIPENWQGATVFRGHALVDQVEILPLDININTRCGFGGHLTGLLLNVSRGRCERSWQISEGGQTIESTATLAPLP